MSKKQTAPAVTIITDLTELGKAIKLNGKAHQKVDAQWQVLAISAIAAFEAHGNVFYINEVYQNLGKGARHKAMGEFFTQFGGVSANTGEGKDKTPFVKDANKKVDMEKARATSWTAMAPSPAPDEVVDYLALIMKVAMRKPKDGQEVKHSAFREEVLRMAKELEEAEAGTEVAGEADPLAGVATA